MSKDRSSTTSRRGAGGGRARLVILAVTAGAISLGFALASRARSHESHETLDSRPRGVTVVAARATQYRARRRYVGTMAPWIEARIGPQLVSAYAETVLVRPGDVVRRGQILATLDCRKAAASSRAVSMQARAVQAEQAALAHEAARIAELRQGGFASANEVEKRAAESASRSASLMETEARMVRAGLEVDDCVLRAPFAGEITTRGIDPGAFVGPGAAVVTLIDRSTVRVVGEVPETDFDVVRPGAPVTIRTLATEQVLHATISRRSPATDPATRTVHLEIDLSDRERALPVGTTAELTIEVGEPEAATAIPLVAASLRGRQATVYVVEGAAARKATFAVKGERGSTVFVDSSLPDGARVVTEGRGGLQDGERVEPKLEAASDDIALDGAPIVTTRAP